MMKHASIARAGLQVRLWLTRFGWGNSLACALCIVGITGWVWGIAHLRAQASVQQRALDQAQQLLDAATVAAPVAPRSAAEQRLDAFYDALGERRYAEQQVRALFAIAAKNGLVLHQGEYKFMYDKNGRFHGYRILLPVKGPYAAVRQFCEQALMAIPFASLDEMHFKRDAIANATLEAKLHFTVYLGDAATAPSGSQASGAVSDSAP